MLTSCIPLSPSPSLFPLSPSPSLFPLSPSPSLLPLSPSPSLLPLSPSPSLFSFSPSPSLFSFSPSLPPSLPHLCYRLEVDRSKSKVRRNTHGYRLPMAPNGQLCLFQMNPPSSFNLPLHLPCSRTEGV